jgi:hypothetical protein
MLEEDSLGSVMCTLNLKKKVPNYIDIDMTCLEVLAQLANVEIARSDVVTRDLTVV